MTQLNVESLPPNVGRWLIARKPPGCDPFLSTSRERGTDWRSKSSTARQESPPRKCCARANKSWTLSISVTPRPKCVVMSRVLIGPNPKRVPSCAATGSSVSLAVPSSCTAWSQVEPVAVLRRTIGSSRQLWKSASRMGACDSASQRRRLRRGGSRLGRRRDARGKGGGPSRSRERARSKRGPRQCRCSSNIRPFIRAG